MNKNTMTSLSKTEVEIVARLTYEEKDIVTAKELCYPFLGVAYSPRTTNHPSRDRYVMCETLYVRDLLQLECRPFSAVT